MKISFILPALIKIPIGGVKVIYRYAEELTKLGHKVTIISPVREGNHPYHLLKTCAIIIRDRWHKVENKPFYKTPPGVEHHIISLPSEKYIPDGDVIIATGWQTAYWVASFSAQKGTKFYFIQGKETWLVNSDKIIYTWKLPLKKIVIAQWLEQTAIKMGETVLGIVPNPIDPQEFYITEPIEIRQTQISMLFHRHPIKGAKEGILVLKKIKKLYPATTATIFSSRKPSFYIPSWINIEIRVSIPKLREIYNSCAIFLHTSYTEGWPLPPAESMMCGCAVVAAANKGIQEYITHNESGLLSPIGNVEAMVENIQYLLNNPMERIRIAIMGQERIRKFSWKKRAKQLEVILVKAI